MKHREETEMRKYLQAHLILSHSVSRDDVRFMPVSQLLERHMTEHGHDG